MSEAEKAVSEFEEADKTVKEMKELLISGKLIYELFDMGRQVHEMEINMAGFMQRLQSAIDSRNTKLVAAKAAVRNTLPHRDTERGYEGEPDINKVGSFTVTSVTKRWLDSKTLINLLKERGVFESLLQLKAFDTQAKEYRLAEEEWRIDYDGVKEWMRTHGLEAEFQASYDEAEDTPRVYGPKPIVLFGETK